MDDAVRLHHRKHTLALALVISRDVVRTQVLAQGCATCQVLEEGDVPVAQGFDHIRASAIHTRLCPLPLRVRSSEALELIQVLTHTGLRLGQVINLNLLGLELTRILTGLEGNIRQGSLCCWLLCCSRTIFQQVMHFILLCVCLEFVVSIEGKAIVNQLVLTPLVLDSATKDQGRLLLRTVPVKLEGQVGRQIMPQPSLRLL